MRPIRPTVRNSHLGTTTAVRGTDGGALTPLESRAAGDEDVEIEGDGEEEEDPSKDIKEKEG